MEQSAKHERNNTLAERRGAVAQLEGQPGQSQKSFVGWEQHQLSRLCLANFG
jgi:hypothetical protein